MTSQTQAPYLGFGLAQRPNLSGREMTEVNAQHAQRWGTMAEEALAQPYKGITTDGQVVPGLFPLQQTGHSLRPVLEAAQRLLAGLDASQREAVSFPIDSQEWQRWFNISPFVFRHGLLLEKLPESQRQLVLDLVRESTSAAGFDSLRNVMSLNETIGEITGAAQEYGEWVYFLSLFGTPSEDGPWGWQLDGHHLNLHCFVLGDQMTFTPAFLGSEPVVATTGKWAGVSVMQEEQDTAFAFMTSLNAEQRSKAIIAPEHTRGAFAGAFRDNLELRYEGLPFAELQPGQQDGFLRVVRTYVDRMRSEHAALKLDEVKQHLLQTYFAWTGGCEADSVFYYRVHSPVILIEFDHQGGVAFDNRVPSRNHIHTLVRTPNGNDYGKDLLRQHYERFHAK